MSSAELIIRLTVLVLGTGLCALGGVLAYRDKNDGCLAYLIAIVGFLMIGAGFPSEAIFQ